jgi:hypothetical protein
MAMTLGNAKRSEFSKEEPTLTSKVGTYDKACNQRRPNLAMEDDLRAKEAYTTWKLEPK